jgi:hypothetical protein
MSIVDKVTTKTAEATVATANMLDGIRTRQSVNNAALVSPLGWAEYDLAINSIAKEVQQVVYKVGEWTVKLLANGAYVCTLGAYKVTLYVGKAAVYGGAAVLTAAQIVWESIRDLMRAVLSTATTAYEAATGFVREAGGKIKDSIVQKATKKGVDPLGNRRILKTDKVITVMA